MAWLIKLIRNYLDAYRSLDKGILYGVFILILFGIFLIFAAGPGVAERNHLSAFHFVYRQLIFLVPAIGVLLVISVLPLKIVRRIAGLVFVISLLGMVYVLLVGEEVKGARRWIYLGVLGSIQPSEFLKPAFAVVCAWLLASARLIKNFHGYILSFVLYAICGFLLFRQPDFGMTLTLTAILAAELFLAGIPKYLIGLLGGALALLSTAGYFLLDHVRVRIDRFLSPEQGEAYQVEKSMETLRNAGLFGKGPGEGIVKYDLPDAHTDFILAVSAEEFGFVLTAGLVLVFAFLLLRGFWLIRKENNYFCQIAVGGLLTQIAFQVIVNMGSTLNLMPTKGMTLPFISYGGSSLVSIGFAFGVILALTRRHTLSRGLE